MKRRKSGYYWVKYNGFMEIAWYDDLQHPFKLEDVIGYWHLCCSTKDILEDNDFEWISKKRLTEPKE